jgi:hypothetical protein
MMRSALMLTGLLALNVFSGSGDVKAISMPTKTGSESGSGSSSPTSQPPAAEPQTAGATSQPAKIRVTESQKDFCNLVWHCGLPMPPGSCPDSSQVEKPSYTYDSARCLEARTLTARGIGPSHPTIGWDLYKVLGMEYRVSYVVEADLPISNERLAYLLADLPLAARLISYFQKEPYTAEYLDAERKHFKGTKGTRLHGDATLISGSSDEKHLFYFGYAVATVAWWTVRRPALMDFAYAQTPNSDPNKHTLHYKLKLLVFPGNGIINRIMNFGLFKTVVYGTIKAVLDDITQTAQKLANGGSHGILDRKDWSADEKRKIGEFLKLP